MSNRRRPNSRSLAARFTPCRSLTSGGLTICNFTHRVSFFKRAETSLKHLGLFVFWALLIPTLIAESSELISANPGQSSVVDPICSVEDAPRLLSELDDRRFDRRQQAARQLVSIGDPLLRPLAVYCLDASPESNWRIKKVIEQIGTSGSEHTFYKSTGILNLLFRANHAVDSQRIQQLIERWRTVRKDKAIQKLRTLGVTIDDPVGELGNAANQRRQWLMANNAMLQADRIAVNDVEVQSTGSTTGATKSKLATTGQSQRSRLARKELIEQIDAIIDADLDDNRKRILDGQASTPAPPNASSLANQQRMLMQANMMGGVSLNRLGVTIELDDKFTGTLEDLQLVRQIPDVADVKFSNRVIDGTLLACFHDVDSIVAVSFENCSFKNAPLAVSSWPRTASAVSFTNQKLTEDILKSFSDSLLVRRLTLAGCELTAAAHLEIRNLAALSDVVIQDTNLDELFFETFENLSGVSRITLSLCKFETSLYRQLKKNKPQLRIDFTPQAFLGIRGTDARLAMFQRPIQIPVDGDRDAEALRRRLDAAQKKQPKPSGCVVSEVIVGSGAEQGGIQAGDLIQEIDGQPIEQFEDLRLHIAQHKVGERLSVKVIRNDTPKDITITLGSFRNANQ